MEQGKQLFKAAADTVKKAYAKETSASEPNRQYFTLDDFARLPTEPKRMAVIGCTGAGKSTLLNLMGGWEYVQDTKEGSATQWEWKWEGMDGAEPLFVATHSVDAVTKETSFANMNWFGDESKRFLALDTPGHNDTSGRNLEEQSSRDVLREQAADLHNKLKSMGHINTILICHDNVTSNRLNPATYAILQMIDEKFAGQPIWENVIVAYTKCNAHENAWKAALASKKTDLQAEIKKQFKGCEVDVPVIAVGGAREDTSEPTRDKAFDELWEFLEKSKPIDTTHLQPFDGAAWKKFESVICARDEALARADSAMVYMNVVFKLAVVFAFFLLRSVLVPPWMSVLMLNHPSTVVDECCIVAAVFYVIRFTKSWYCLQFFYETWVYPYIKPYADKVFPPKDSKQKAE